LLQSLSIHNEENGREYLPMHQRKGISTTVGIAIVIALLAIAAILYYLFAPA